MRTINFSIIIPLLYFDDISKLCLESVLSVTRDRNDIEIIVVDNNPFVNDKTTLKTYRESILVIKEPRKGSYVARNSGVKEAKGENIIFCDADCIVEKQWFTILEQALQKSEVVCGACIIYSPRKIFDFFQAKLAKKWAILSVNGLGFRAGVAALKRSVFYRIGYFDESFLYSGDIDFGLRLHLHGYQVYFEKKAIVYHYPRKTLKEIINQYYNYGYGNACIRRKWRGNAPDFIKRGEYRIISAMYHFFAWLYWGCNIKKDRFGRKKIWHYFIGIIDFFYFFGFINGYYIRKIKITRLVKGVN